MNPITRISRLALIGVLLNCPVEAASDAVLGPEVSISLRGIAHHTIEVGEPLFVADNPSGFLVLSEVPAAEDLWLLATGTGIAPFLSILRTAAPWERYRRVILVHAARHAAELVYQDLISELKIKRTKFSYVSMLSRDKTSTSLAGRIPAAIDDGRLEAAAGAQITPERSQFMLCGNPGMLKEGAAELVARGLRKNRRRTPGHITVESFW